MTNEATGGVRSTRRQFLGSAGGTAAGAWLALHWPAIAAAADAAAHAHAHGGAVGPSGPPPAPFLSVADLADVDAICAQIVPSEGEGPGAREAGAATFIDRSLATWLHPDADRFVTALHEFQAAFIAAHPGVAFAKASAADQHAFLETRQDSEFFGGVRFMTLLGMFASPAYGGNRDGAGWKLIGFEDSHLFQPPFGWYDRDYPGFEVRS